MLAGSILVFAIVTIAMFYRQKNKHRSMLDEQEKKHQDDLALSVAKRKRMVAKVKAESDSRAAKAREEGAADAFARFAAVELHRNLGDYLSAEAFEGRGHGVILHRGGHPDANRISVRFGIQLTNYGRHDVAVVAVKDLIVSMGRGTLLLHKRAQHFADDREPIEPSATKTVLNIDVPNAAIGDYVIAVMRETKIHVQGRLLISGQWGDEIKEMSFAQDMLLTTQGDYLHEMRTAFFVLRNQLKAANIDVTDAELFRGNEGWTWRLACNPTVEVAVPDEWPDVLRRDEALKTVAKLASEQFRSRFGEAPPAEHVRIAEHAAATEDAETDREAEQEAVDIPKQQR